MLSAFFYAFVHFVFVRYSTGIKLNDGKKIAIKMRVEKNSLNVILNYFEFSFRNRLHTESVVCSLLSAFPSVVIQKYDSTEFIIKLSPFITNECESDLFVLNRFTVGNNTTYFPLEKNKMKLRQQMTNDKWFEMGQTKCKWNVSQMPSQKDYESLVIVRLGTIK